MKPIGKMSALPPTNSSQPDTTFFINLSGGGSNISKLAYSNMVAHDEMWISLYFFLFICFPLRIKKMTLDLGNAKVKLACISLTCLPYAYSLWYVLTA